MKSKSIDQFLRLLRKHAKGFRWEIWDGGEIRGKNKDYNGCCPIEAVSVACGESNWYKSGARYLGIRCRERDKIVRAADNGNECLHWAHKPLRKRILKAIGLEEKS